MVLVVMVVRLRQCSGARAEADGADVSTRAGLVWALAAVRYAWGLANESDSLGCVCVLWRGSSRMKGDQGSSSHDSCVRTVARLALQQ